MTCGGFLVEFSSNVEASEHDAIFEIMENEGFNKVDDCRSAEFIIYMISSREKQPNAPSHTLNTSAFQLYLVSEQQQLDYTDYWNLLNSENCDVMFWKNTPDCHAHLSKRVQRWKSINQTLFSTLVKENLVGCSPSWTRTLRETIEAACFSDCPILLLGESGTGKEMLARLIHSIDKQRKKNKLVILDCSTIVQELSGSEFFGHEKGAFTGAHSGRDGAFEMADGGTLFLDEIGELPLHLQAQLLRVIQEKSYKRVGGNSWFNTNFRLICATNRELEEESHKGNFRQDLFYRIACKVIRLPPLRERSEDIIPLAQHFLAEHFDSPPDISEPVRQYLISRQYPGNVRHLRQLITRMSLKHCGIGDITPGAIPLEDRPTPEQLEAHGNGNIPIVDGFRTHIYQSVMVGKGLKEIGRVAEELAIEIAMDENNGNIRSAATMLDVSVRTLQLRKVNQKSR